MQKDLFGLAIALAVLAPATALADEATNDDPTPLATVAPQIVLGLLHTCALTAAGDMKCWGLNSFGMLGDGTTKNRSKPVSVQGLGSNVTTIDAGAAHTCAVAGGVLQCWGDNDEGALGDGTTTERHHPVNVKGLTGHAATVSGGFGYTCAVTGGVECWGANDSGQLGDGTTIRHTKPAPVSGLKNIIAVAAGDSHACALNKAGGVQCWGANGNGQLGDGTKTERHAPVAVQGLQSGVIAISAGDIFTCALTKAGGVKCWGDNEDGELGFGESKSGSSTPIDVHGLTKGVIAVAAGNDHACALTKNGGVKCWGDNFSGQLGDGTTKVRFTPVNVTGLARGVIAIGAGGRSFGQQHTCALTKAGAAKCWGYNVDGQLGDGTTTDRHTPVNVKGF